MADGAADLTPVLQYCTRLAYVHEKERSRLHDANFSQLFLIGIFFEPTFLANYLYFPWPRLVALGARRVQV